MPSADVADGRRHAFIPIHSGAEHPTLENVNRLTHEFANFESTWTAPGHCDQWNSYANAGRACSLSTTQEASLSIASPVKPMEIGHFLRIAGAYSVKTGSFVAERPRPWMSRALVDTGVISNFDVDPAGGRVLAWMPTGTRDEQSPNHVTIRLNAADEVRRRLAVTPPTR